MVSDTVREKIERFKELVKKGYSVSKAMRESKLHPAQYKKYYDEIWSDPGMKPYMPQKKSEDPQASQSQNSQASEKPPTIEETEKTPRDIIEEFEAAFRDFEARRARIKEILEKMGFKVEDVYMRRDEVERIILSILFLGASI